MSAGPGSALDAVRSDSVQIAHSAVVLGTARLGEGSLLAQGAVIRSSGTGVEVGTGSAVIENSVVVGTSEIPTVIGRRTTFGHRCKVTANGTVFGVSTPVPRSSVQALTLSAPRSTPNT